MRLLIKNSNCAARAIAGAALLLCTAAAADDAPPAHYRQDCVACHVRMTGGEGETLYRRKDRLVDDYDALLARVEYCRRGTGADWSEQQSAEVVRYLNRRFYHFPQPR